MLKRLLSVASVIDYSRQQTYASNMQEIRNIQEILRELHTSSWKKTYYFPSHKDSMYNLGNEKCPTPYPRESDVMLECVG